MRIAPLLCAVAVLVGCSESSLTDTTPAEARGGGKLAVGETVAVGNGTATAFATVLPTGRPTTIGVELTAAAMDGLPTTFSDCGITYDLDGDGTIDPMTECRVGHEYMIDFPDQDDVPFQYVMLNFNPLGHGPPGIYEAPHFDIHFYIQDMAEVMAIRPGECPIFTNCDDFATATIPVPEPYVAPGYADLGAVEPGMGNHLINTSAPEITGEEAFSRTFIYGAYDGAITFYEPMITREYLLAKVKNCDPIAQPEAWAEAGWYPTTYCTDYKQGSHRITLEDFVYRETEVLS